MLVLNILKKDITKLLKKLISDKNREKAQKIALIILTLVQLLQTVADLVDFQKCKSVIDEISKMIDLILLLGNDYLPKVNYLTFDNIIESYKTTYKYLNNQTIINNNYINLEFLLIYLMINDKIKGKRLFVILVYPSFLIFFIFIIDHS